MPSRCQPAALEGYAFSVSLRHKQCTMTYIRPNGATLLQWQGKSHRSGWNWLAHALHDWLVLRIVSGDLRSANWDMDTKLIIVLLSVVCVTYGTDQNPTQFILQDSLLSCGFSNQLPTLHLQFQPSNPQVVRTPPAIPTTYVACWHILSCMYYWQAVVRTFCTVFSTELYWVAEFMPRARL